MNEIRQAIFSDVEDIISLGALMHQESPRYRGMDYDPGVCRNTFNDIVAAGGIFLADDNGGNPGTGLAGMIVGVLQKNFFGNDIMARDLCVYVHPKHRGGDLFERLVDHFEAWAEVSGAVQVQVGISAGIKPDPLEKKYCQLGYQVIGSYLMKEF